MDSHPAFELGLKCQATVPNCQSEFWAWDRSQTITLLPHSSTMRNLEQVQAQDEAPTKSVPSRTCSRPLISAGSKLTPRKQIPNEKRWWEINMTPQTNDSFHPLELNEDCFCASMHAISTRKDWAKPARSTRYQQFPEKWKNHRSKHIGPCNDDNRTAF